MATNITYEKFIIYDNTIADSFAFLYEIWMLTDHRDGCRVQVFSLILDSSVGLLAGFRSAGDWVSETFWVRILHSSEEDNLSPFDLKIACLCQSIEINNNKYVYRQSQVRMPNGSGVSWAECLLTIGTGCRVHVFSLILDS